MFYICWGKKSYHATEGLGADFCPICRQAAIVEVRQIRSQNHIYHIGIGKGELVGRFCQCTNCGSKWPLQAGTLQSSVYPGTPVSLETLLAETFPRYGIVYGERLQQEATLRRDPSALDQDTRLSLIVEPFFVLNNDVEEESNRTSWETIVGGMGCLGAIGFALATVIAFATGSPVWGFGLLVFTVGLAWLSMALSTAATDRFMRDKIYPRLSSCLAPLNPTLEELTAILEQVEAKSAKQTKLENFLPFLEEARSRMKPPQEVDKAVVKFELF